MLLKTRKKVLDFGCGDGYRSIYLGRFADYYGVDISNENIERAKAKYLDRSFVLISENSLPFDSCFFDEIYLFDVMEHLSSPDAALKEILRCLKPGGLLIIEIPYFRSEQMLEKIHSGYLLEAGHKSVFAEAQIEQIFKSNKLTLLKTIRKRGIENIYMSLQFLCGNSIVRDTGDLKNESRFFRRIMSLFSEDFFTTRLFVSFKLFWIIFPVWIVTYPVGRLFSIVFPKAIRYELKKN
ncbi:MAG: class I SAM-dependent methyltransferase [Candidatus Saganbacteria bacterium]|nr:class I SAM-dependent methyltransferase [Candidatus Saganbacteria bacterium]